MNVVITIVDAMGNSLGGTIVASDAFVQTERGFRSGQEITIPIHRSGRATHVEIQSPWGIFTGPLDAGVNSGDEIVFRENDTVTLYDKKHPLQRKAQGLTSLPKTPVVLHNFRDGTTFWTD